MSAPTRKAACLTVSILLLVWLSGCGGGGGEGSARVSDLEGQLAMEQELREAAEEEEAERRQEVAELTLAVRTLTTEQEEEEDDQQAQIAALTKAVQDLTAAQEEDEEPETPSTGTTTLGDLTGGTTTTTTTTTADDTTPTTSAPVVRPSITETAAGSSTTSTTTTTPTTTTTTTTTSEDQRQRALEIQKSFDLADTGDPPMPGLTTGPFAGSPRAGILPGTTRGTQTLEASGYTRGAGPAVRVPFISMKGTESGTRRTIVAIADREVSRRFLDHYGQFKESDAALRVEINATGSPDALMIDTTMQSLPITSENEDLFVTHGFSSSIRAPTAAGTMAADNDPAAKEATSFSGTIHGITGRFGCGTGCQLSVAATYAENTTSPQVDVDEDNDPNTDPVSRYSQRTLTSVGLTVPTGGTIYFTPSSPSALLYLGPAGATGAGVLSETDNAYMLFGWWKDEPTAPTAPHPVGVFAEVVGTNATWPSSVVATGSARYTGPAVGLYVEHSSSGAQTGEFTAQATLNATFAAANTVVSGNVQNFNTTGGSTTSGGWHLTLSQVTGALTNGAVTVGPVDIVGLPGADTEGEWQATFLANHQYSRYSDAATPNNDRPLSAVGEFNAKIIDDDDDDLLHLIGAFGVHDVVGIAK